MSDPISIRPLSAADLPLVKSSWFGTVRHESLANLRVPDNVLKPRMEAVMALLLSVGLGLAACPRGDPDIVLAWLLCRPGARVDFAYTKVEFRGRGLQRELLREAGIARVALLTFGTRHALDYARERPGTAVDIYLPWIELGESDAQASE